MNTLPQLFEELLKQVSPESSRLKIAQTLPHVIRDHLQESEDIKTISPHSLLSGSYKRHTAIAEIKDVDILVFVEPEYLNSKPSAVFSELSTALESTPGIIHLDTKPQRRSIRLTIEDYDFQLDIVPCIAPNVTEKPLYVPDRPRQEWMESDPLGYATALSELNGRRSDKVVPLVKMFKAWRDGNMIYKRPKSYWLECMVFSLASRDDFVQDGDSYAVIVHRLFDRLYGKFKSKLDDGESIPRIIDPMLGNNVTAEWPRSHFEAFMSNLQQSREHAAAALNTDQGDDGERAAAELWISVFGKTWFEGTIFEEGMLMANRIGAGRVGISSSGLLAVAGSTHDSLAPIRKHRFYGGQ